MDDGGYRLVAADLRDVESLTASVSPHLDPTLPTLVISECCLVYLEADEAEAVTKWAAEVTKQCEASAFVLYDPIRPDDAFGRQMMMNIESRGSPLRGIEGAKDPDGQVNRMKRCGFADAGAVDMNGTWDYLTRRDPVDVARITRLEMFDEIEEWRLIQAHYCIAWGVNQLDGGTQMLDAIKLTV
jgi:tRNA wybutosine-synthesizing protein 4